MHRKPYHRLAMGGTFDHFHVGHQHFIDFAANISDNLVIGVTTNKLLKGKKFPDQIEDFHTRKRAVISYCKKKNYPCLVVPLDDPYGPPIDKEEKFGALAVTEFTVAGAKAINDLRKTMKMRDLPVHVCQMLKDENGQIISSTRIRAGEIDRFGNNYISLFSQDITLNQQQRKFFSQLQGNLEDRVKRSNKPTIIVGDTTLKKALAEKWNFDLAVFDGKEKRQTTDIAIDKNKIDLTAINPAGDISQDLVEKIRLAILSNKKYLFVEGEEDLAAVVLVLLLPLGSYLYYGQPDQGLVEIEVSEQLKRKFSQALEK